ncbi:MAG TPA: BACON domain-containing protein [Chitinophagaceae bacterium]|nr:BACON domain-containing protein [Chitinophagaceae bacterium]
MNKNISIILFLLYTLCLGSCAKDESPFVFRNIDELNFGYTESEEEFTVRTNGNWEITTEDDWISLSPSKGVGNGESVEFVTVKVERNMAEQRQGNFFLNAAGESLEIVVTQDEGFVDLKAVRLEGALIKGEAITDASLIIPYEKGPVGEKVKVNLEVLKEAAEGISTLSDFEIEIASEKGELKIPLEGTPAKSGEVEIKISIPLFDHESTVTATVLAEDEDPLGTIYFEETFDDMVWGGDYVASEKGIRGSFMKVEEEGGSVIDETQPITEVGDGTDGSNDLFLTMAQSYRDLRGILGSWKGKRVYERPGHLKISTAGSNDGYLTTPEFENISNETNVKVSVDLSRWSTSSPKIFIEVLNMGTTETQYLEVNPGQHSREWFTHSFYIQGASSQTRVSFKADENSEGRFFIDNIIVEKSN